MLAFLGPAQAVAISPFCTLEDLTSWTTADKSTFSAFDADAVWRQMLISHFHSAFTCLRCLEETPNEETTSTPEKLAAKLRGQNVKEVYISLRKASSHCPFVLEPRARLLLEIHELLEWDRHRKRFLEQQQAVRLAEAFSKNAQKSGALNQHEDWSVKKEQLRIEMVPAALELVSLQTMMGDSRPVQLPQLEEVNWGQSAELDLRNLMDKRLQQRRTWWQRQRDYLLQGLEQH